MTGLTTSRVKMLTTGGTISTTNDPHTGRSAPTLDGRSIAGLSPDECVAGVVELARVPSWSLDLRDMQGIARAIRDEARSDDDAGLVVTVGTSTLEYVSFMTDLFLDSDVTVVFTGAMRKADAAQPDGPRNLRDAIAVAHAVEARSRGVLVCFHGRIMSARGVWKRHREAVDAFVDTRGDVGAVDKGQVFFTGDPTPRTTLAGEVEPNVAVVKAFPGADGAALDALAGRVRGVVVEGLPGAGGLPRKMLDALSRLTERGTLVVVSSRAPEGRVPSPPTGGTGSPLLGLPLLSAGDLTTEKAWVLLAVVLGQCSDSESASDLFRAIAGAER